MHLLADEGVDSAIVRVLRTQGHDVQFIAEFAAGSDDVDILAWSAEQKRVLITHDKDFGELVFKLRLGHVGVILLRLHGFPPESKANIVLEVFLKHEDELVGAFTVITPGLVKIRTG